MIYHTFLLMGISLLLSIFLPDLYIPNIVKSYKAKIGVTELDENTSWYFLPNRLGWVERTLFWLVWFFLKSQFVTFLGIWFALKVVGDYPAWGKHEGHKGRARFIIFMIGTSLSVISVIVIALLTRLFLFRFW